MKPRRYGAVRTENRILIFLQSSLVVSLAAHWVFQGMLYMDRTERAFKLLLDAVFVMLAAVVVGDSASTLLVALFIGHTLNFVFNGHINGVLKCFGISRANERELEQYLAGLARRVNREPSIAFAAAFGSLTRGQMSDKSDIDLRLIRRRGLSSAVRSCTFTLAERSRSLFSGVPLDVYLLDNAEGLRKLRPDEPALILKEHGSMADHHSRA